MTPGPAPMPTHLRILGGNASKRPLNDKEPQPPPVEEVIDAPDWLVELDVPIATLRVMTVVALQKLAKDLGVRGASKLVKENLIIKIGEVSEGDRIRFWRRIQSDLIDMKVMTKADGHALALLCDALGVFVECRRVIRDEGMTYQFTTKAGVEMPVQRPEVGIASAALSQAMRLMDRFGLNPAYRTKLKVEAEDEESGLDALRRRGSSSAG